MLAALDDGRRRRRSPRARRPQARAIHEEDIAANQRIGRYGAELIPGRDPRDDALQRRRARHRRLRHRARRAARGLGASGKLVHVTATETRPLLQGARLTAWELREEGIPFTLIPDSAAGLTMRRRRDRRGGRRRGPHRRQRRHREQDRHLPARRPRQRKRRPLLRRRPDQHDRPRDADRRRDPDRRALTRTRCAPSAARRSPRTASTPRTPPSTSRPPRTSPRSSPRTASPALRTRRACAAFAKEECPPVAETERIRAAVIGGSGFYNMEGLGDIETFAVDTPYGPTSDVITVGTLDGQRVAFLPRHGVGHRILPRRDPGPGQHLGAEDARRRVHHLRQRRRQPARGHRAAAHGRPGPADRPHPRPALDVLRRRARRPHRLRRSVLPSPARRRLRRHQAKPARRCTTAAPTSSSRARPSPPAPSRTSTAPGAPTLSA